MAYSGLSEVFGAVNIGGVASGVATVAPLILVAIIIGCATIVAFWIRKFKFNVNVYSQRANGELTAPKRDKGAFMRDIKTGMEYLTLLKDMKAVIPPIPNYLIKKNGNKDEIDLVRTTGSEYIPAVVTNRIRVFESTDGNPRPYKQIDNFKDILIYPEQLKGWARNEIVISKNKFNPLRSLEKWAPIVVPITVMAIALLAISMIMDGMKEVASMCNVPRQIVSCMLPLWTAKLFKR